MNVKIVKMEEMKVASFHAFGTHPEMEAVGKMQAWAKARGLIDGEKYPVFGFDTIHPKPGSTEHGYEVWVKLDDESDTEGADIKEVPAGRYAVLHSEGLENIGPNWQKLVEWVKNSEFEPGCSQCLEGHYFGSSEDGYFALDLYMPIK